MNTEIYIENYRLDVSKDISTLLSFAIDDVRDFSERSTTFSKTIVLPGTANNNKLFGHIFNVGQSNDYDSTSNNVGYNFNVSKSAACIIFQDQMQTFKGVLRLMEINITNGNIEYEVSVFGELAGLNVALSNGLLEDLDFSAYDHLYNETNIAASWDNPGGSGYYYPLIDYGDYSTLKHDWDIRTLRPALYVKEYIDKMFEAANYRYSSDLFETDRFKKFVIPHNQKLLTKLTADILNSSDSTTFHIIDHLAGLFENDVQFDTVVGGLFSYTETPLSGSEMSRKFTYTGTVTLATILTIHLGGYYNFDIGAGLNITIKILKNGSVIYTDPSLLSGNAGRDLTISVNYSLPVTLSTGDYFEVHFSLGGNLAGPADGNAYIQTPTLNVTSSSSVSVSEPIDYGEMIEINAAIPKNIRQIDFLTSIVKLSNLYVYEDKFDSRLIRFTPYVDFYSTDSNNSVDWTYKLNRDKPLKIKPMSELNAKKYEFKYKSDSDYYNDLYKKRYNQSYGDYVFTSEFEFAEQTKSLELIFSGTPLVGYVGEDKVYSTIFKQTNSLEEHVDSNIRILQTKKVIGVTSWDILNGATILGSYTDYGYGGHFDDPDAPANDLNFGALNELFFVLTTGDLSVTQFNVYYSGYMAEITNKDSKLITGNFYLTQKDIYDLDFSKFVYLDGVLFRLNKITDYNMSTPSDCQVQLLKINFLIY